MIVDNNSSTNVAMSRPLASETSAPSGEPPSYDAVVRDVSSGPYVPVGANKGQNVKVSPEQTSQQPNASTPQVPSMPTVYNYVNPITQEHIVSLLPPDHPQMICLQEGRHIPDGRFGLLGVLAAIFWFPAGIICCMLDRHVRCKRCGVVLSSGITPTWD
ncbi:hypothetical protein BKA93DRAFT_860920 [Sparassis latifolia]|uniref:Uncharacterized protein n=1 Tax=Sparassis crispa TaxID=139825 RepID=A0A401GFQ3_9APHY|nr:predicted protein [Sparassis crispa]GBE81017.1 predicted protein [Sparassis crispa]